MKTLQQRAQYVLKRLRQNARARRVGPDGRRASRAVLLTVEDIIVLRLDTPCTYCGDQLPDDVGGLDRIDNSLGYTVDNVLPCCSPCNYARGSLLSVDEFRAAMALRIESTGRGHAWDHLKSIEPNRTTRPIVIPDGAFLWRGKWRIPSNPSDGG